MHHYLVDLLECPACHGALKWDITNCDEKRIYTATTKCVDCNSIYPVRDGIGLFLIPDPTRNDFWEQAGGNSLVQYLQENPLVERELMQNPIEILGPADLWCRSIVLEERGEFEQAKEVAQIADRGIYTPEYRACSQSQINYVVEKVSDWKGPIIDIASGRCGLVEEIALKTDNYIVASDFSPTVLRRNQRYLERLGIYQKISLLAFDAQFPPFKAKSIGMMTTNLGLQNIAKSDSFLQELRRVVNGSFLSISSFYPDDDENNRKAFEECGLETRFQFRQEAIKSFTSAGWQIEAANICKGKASPTPIGVIIKGATIDLFPRADTTLEWCVIDAR